MGSFCQSTELVGLDVTQHNETIMLEMGEEYDMDKTHEEQEVKKDDGGHHQQTSSSLSAITIVDS